MKIKVFRFQEGRQSYQSYDVKVEKGKTVLDCLNEIKWNKDGSLTYRRSCRSAICGSCAVRINKKAMLACETQLEDVIENNQVLIESLDNMNVIKDLVVDQTIFWKKIEEVMPWLVTEEKKELKESSMTAEEIEDFKESENCIMCGCCYSDCDAVRHNDKFLGPTALVKGFRFVMDSRDNATMKRLNTYTNKGLWHCSHAYKCIQQCPKDIQPGYRIADLRESALSASIKYNVGAKNALFYKKSIRRTGKLDEAMYILNVKGIFGLLGMTNLSINLLLKGRIPNIFMKKIKGIKQIKGIYEELET